MSTDTLVTTLQNIEVLLDHDADPREFKNLVADPKHTAALAEMRRLLKEGWRGALPEARGQSAAAKD